MFPLLLSSAIFMSFMVLNVLFYAFKVDGGGTSGLGNEVRIRRKLSKPELANYSLAVVWCVFCLGIPFLEPSCSFCNHFSQFGTAIVVVASVLIAGVVGLSGLRIAQRMGKRS